MYREGSGRACMESFDEDHHQGSLQFIAYYLLLHRRSRNVSFGREKLKAMVNVEVMRVCVVRTEQ